VSNLSDDGKAFVSFDGRVDLGVVDGAEIASVGLRAGPIRLQVGYPGPKGFGFLHIRGYPDRVLQIQGMGYKSVVEFCAEIASNFTIVGRARDERIVVAWRTPYYDLQLILEWKENYWTIVTGVPARVARKFEQLCEVVRTSGSEPTPDVAKRPRFATLSLPKKVSPGGNGS
jgi:hypothetical protein